MPLKGGIVALCPYLVSRVPDSLALRRGSGQTAYYVSCNACQEILGVLIGLSTAETYCGFPLRARESVARASTRQQPKLST